VTKRGVPIAKLVPLRAAEPRDSRRERLARAGLLRLGAGRIRGSVLRVPKGPSVGESVMHALLSERRQGR
jgi:antitoxin (DNA-binding transcriptional repressor) of toxin-antitoxin stability system